MLKGNPVPFRKPCKRCQEMFQPTGKFSLYCSKCKLKGGHKQNGKIFR